jgi:integrase/recombinase XerD
MLVRHWSARTVEGYGEEIGRFFGFLEAEGIATVACITPAVVESYRTHLFYRTWRGRRLVAHSQARGLSAVKAFARFLAEEQYVLTDPGQGVALPRLPRLLPRVLLTEDDVVQLLETPDVTTTLGLRDRAILEVLYSSAVRNTELRQVRIDDVSLRREELYIREGKGGKSRVVPLGEEACYWLGLWLEEGRPSLVQPGTPQTVFLSWRGRPLTRESMSDLVVRNAQAAGLSEHVTPHLLRHCCATHMLARGAGLRHLQELLGHECAQTTQRYTRVDLSDLREVHRRCHPREVPENGEVTP